MGTRYVCVCVCVRERILSERDLCERQKMRERERERESSERATERCVRESSAR